MAKITNIKEISVKILRFFDENSIKNCFLLFLKIFAKYRTYFGGNLRFLYQFFGGWDFLSGCITDILIKSKEFLMFLSNIHLSICMPSCKLTFSLVKVNIIMIEQNEWKHDSFNFLLSWAWSSSLQFAYLAYSNGKCSLSWSGY